MIRAFGDGDLDEAAALLERRHRRQLAAEPLLPATPDFRAGIEALQLSDGAAGAIADGGFVVGASRDDPVWGPNIWIESAGHAVDEPELLRDLYASLAGDWIERGLKAHYAIVPATDAALVDAWFRLGFGAQQAHGIVEIADVAWPSSVREAREDDVEALVELAPLLTEHQHLSPVFGPARRWSDDDIRKEVLEDLAREDVGNLVVEVDGRLVANFVVCSIELASGHAGLARPPGAAYLAFAITRPDARGTGAGVALTDACFAWARERGYTAMVTDWRVTNLLSSRFWPKRGFRTSFLRLHRLLA
jgi:ribosomal protein S18 acetylase RimI-like enzyme